MKVAGVQSAGVWIVFSAIVLLQEVTWAHVTLRPNEPLRPGSHAVVSLVVPSERHVDVTRVTIQVPEAFLKAGGRLTSVDYPAGWGVRIEKDDKPDEIYGREMEQRARREAGAEGGAQSAKSDEERREEDIRNELLKKWITKVTFEGGSIPPGGFKAFLLIFQLPEEPGKYHFPAVQIFADGKEVSWSELGEGAEHPATSLVLERQYDVRNLTLLVSAVAVVLLVLLVQLTKRFKKRKENQS